MSFFAARYFGIVSTVLSIQCVLMGIVIPIITRDLNDLSIYDTANWWDPNSSFAILHRMNEIRVPFFLSHFPSDNETLAISDVGCGGGFVSEAVATNSSTFAVTGIDISEPSLEIAREHGSGIPNLMYISGSIYAIPLPSESQDVVIVSDVLEHLSDIPAALKEVHRVLRPGGVFVFDTIARTWWSWLGTYLVAQEILGIVQRGAHDWNMFIQPDELERMIIEAGFDTERKKWTGLVGVLTPEKMIDSWSKFDLVGEFIEDIDDMRSCYMGFATKRN
jgi:2-polyprenyl-6-hydroxyphenyl methylase / 3-demethylubiquinone-9 3-methyltransferase